MPVIAIAGNKGGVGKTTLSLNLATALSQNNSVIILDADPQGSSFQWREISDNDDAIAVQVVSDDIEKQATALLETYQYIVIDCPPSVHASQTTDVLNFCDLVLIPVQPSPIDLWATVHIEEAVSRAREKNSPLSALLIINQIELRSTLSRLVRDALAEIDLPVAKTAIRRRAIYRNSIMEGKTIFDMGKKASDAITELNQLIEEII